jgi:hypothetical protein
MIVLVYLHCGSQHPMSQLVIHIQVSDASVVDMKKAALAARQKAVFDQCPFHSTDDYPGNEGGQRLFRLLYHGEDIISGIEMCPRTIIAGGGWKQGWSKS